MRQLQIEVFLGHCPNKSLEIWPMKCTISHLPSKSCCSSDPWFPMLSIIVCIDRKVGGPTSSPPWLLSVLSTGALSEWLLSLHSPPSFQPGSVLLLPLTFLFPTKPSLFPKPSFVSLYPPFFLWWKFIGGRNSSVRSFRALPNPVNLDNWSHLC